MNNFRIYAAIGKNKNKPETESNATMCANVIGKPVAPAHAKTRIFKNKALKSKIKNHNTRNMEALSKSISTKNPRDEKSTNALIELMPLPPTHKVVKNGHSTRDVEKNYHFNRAQTHLMRKNI